MYVEWCKGFFQYMNLYIAAFFSGVCKNGHYKYPIVAFLENAAIDISIAALLCSINVLPMN